MRITLSCIAVSPVFSPLTHCVWRATVPTGIRRLQGLRKFYSVQSTTQEPKNYIANSKMVAVALKRKQASSTSVPRSGGSKRAKNGVSRSGGDKRSKNVVSTSGVDKRAKNGVSPSAKVPRAKQALETVTDSDPIVESDTTENSGDDNGVDWPSDHASEAQDSSADEGAKVVNSKTASGNGAYVLPRKERLAQKSGISMISPSTHQHPLTSQSINCLQGNPCQAKGPRSRAQSCQTQRPSNRPIETVMGTITKKVSRAIGRAEEVGRRVV